MLGREQRGAGRATPWVTTRPAQPGSIFAYVSVGLLRFLLYKSYCSDSCTLGIQHLEGFMISLGELSKL